MKLFLALVLAGTALGLAACTDVQSTAASVNEPGSWQVAFVRLVDVDGPPYVEDQPAPEYPPRLMHAPTADAASCAPGCECGWVTASDECDGDVGQTCRAWGGFVETCAAANTRLDCSNIAFDGDDRTTGVCQLEDLGVMTEFGYGQIQRYQVTLTRTAYDRDDRDGVAR